MNELRLWRVEGMLLREAYSNVFAPCSSYYDIRKEVRKRMAIDYKVEWDKLLNKHGHREIESGAGVIQRLGSLMYAQIDRTIKKREELMEEFIKEHTSTNIIDGSKHCHMVGVVINKGIFGNVSISKEDFDAWCKKKEKGGK